MFKKLSIAVKNILSPREVSQICLKDFSKKIEYIPFKQIAFKREKSDDNKEETDEGAKNKPNSNPRDQDSTAEQTESNSIKVKIILTDIKKQPNSNPKDYEFTGKTVKEAQKKAIEEIEIPYTKNYLVFIDIERNKTFDKSKKADYEKFLASHNLSEANHGWCIEKLLIILVITLLIIAILGIMLDILVSFEHKKLLFFSVMAILAFSASYYYINSFYDNLYTNTQKEENVFPYYRNKTQDNSFSYIHYIDYKPDIYKLYPFFIAGYFVIILTVTFYVSSLMATPQNNSPIEKKVTYVKQ